MNETNEPPDNGKKKPWEHEAGDEHKERVAPLHVNHGGEYILADMMIIIVSIKGVSNNKLLWDSVH